MRRVLCLLALCAIAFAGCDQTQDKNKRAEVAAKRKLAARKPVVVRQADPRIRVEQVAAVGRGKDAVAVVRLTNTSQTALSDLPINLRAADGTVLNKGPNIYYFANHVPAIGPGRTVEWVAQLGRRLPKHGLTARVGAPVRLQPDGARLPELAVDGLTAKKGKVTGNVKNDSGLPQYVVEIAVTARSHGRYVAAGRGRVTKLTGDGEQPFVVPLQGRLGKLQPDISLLPGILKTG